MSARKASGASRARRARRYPSAGRALEGVIGDPDAFFAAFETAEALISQIPRKRPRRTQPVTLEQVLRAVVLILVSHLSGFDYRKEQASPRARTARMPAALSAVLEDSVTPKGAR